MVIQKIKTHAHALREEFKKQTSTAVMAAFGLIIALAWKDVITAAINNISWVSSYGPLISAVVLTIVSVIGILIVSKWAEPKEMKEEKNKK